MRDTDVTTDQASFAWDEVPCGSRHGDITIYNARLVNPAGDQDFSNTISDTHVTFTGLQSCTEYIFSVSALNGPMSDEIRITTDIISE